MNTFEFAGKTFTFITEAEPSSRLLPYPKNYHEVAEGEEYDFEMVAYAVDENKEKYMVSWIFSDIKGDGQEYDAFDYANIYGVTLIG